MFTLAITAYSIFLNLNFYILGSSDTAQCVAKLLHLKNQAIDRFLKKLHLLGLNIPVSEAKRPDSAHYSNIPSRNFDVPYFLLRRAVSKILTFLILFIYFELLFSKLNVDNWSAGKNPI